MIEYDICLLKMHYPSKILDYILICSGKYGRKKGKKSGKGNPRHSLERAKAWQERGKTERTSFFQPEIVLYKISKL